MIELRTLGAVIKDAYEGQPNTNAYTDSEKVKLADIEDQATKNGTDADLLNRANHTGSQPSSTISDIANVLDRSNHTGTQPSSSISDIGYVMDRANHTGFQTITTITGLNDAMDLKVDKVTGKELSDNNFTAEEKTKLAGLEGPHFKGTHASLSALQAAGIVAVAGDYADVDGGSGQETFRCIWDVSNMEWVQQLGTSTQLTGSQIKSEYEAQPDTNAYTDAEKSKLAGIATEATKNSTDATLLNRANHTGTQAQSTIIGLETALSGKVNVDGVKVLSDNNYTTAEKTKLSNIIIDGTNNFTWRYKGTWNAATNSPSLIDGTGTSGDLYIVTTGATRSLGSMNYRFQQYDFVVFLSGTWRRVSVNPENYKPRGTVSAPIPALYCTRSTTNNSYARVTEARITNWTAQYNPYSILNDGVISIPSWATHARITTNIVLAGSEAADVRYGSYIYRNSSIITADTRIINNFNGSSSMPATGIVPVSSADTFHVSLWHSFAGNKELSPWSWLQVELFESI